MQPLLQHGKCGNSEKSFIFRLPSGEKNSRLPGLENAMDEENFTQKLGVLFRQGKDVATGPGDDCAVIDDGTDRLLLAAADQLISSVHYLDGCPAACAAVKLLHRNISDIAAMGGVPTHALVTLAVNPMNEAWLTDFHVSLAKCAETWDISVIGGDIARLFVRGEVCSLTILGRVERNRLCLRSGAKTGDLLYVTGTFGNAFHSGHHLTFRPRLDEARFLAGRFTRAMMDVSDGLLKDARRMALASGCALSLDPLRIPLRHGASAEGALTDGEDYELLIAVPPALSEELEKAWCFPETELHCIGSFTGGTPGRVSGLERFDLSKMKTGYDHFHEETV